MIIALLPLACADLAKQTEARRQWEMADHQHDLVDARDALIRGDLAGAQEAGKRLASPDPVPGLPDAARPHLDAVRTGGRALHAASTLPMAAERLMDVTADCSACHRALAIPVADPPRNTPREQLWLALTWDDAASWDAGVGGLGAAGLGAATDWDARRAAVARALLDGSLK